MVYFTPLRFAEHSIQIVDLSAWENDTSPQANPKLPVGYKDIQVQAILTMDITGYITGTSWIVNGYSMDI